MFYYYYYDYESSTNCCSHSGAKTCIMAKMKPVQDSEQLSLLPHPIKPGLICKTLTATYQCEMCFKFYETAGDRRAHVQLHCEVPFKCDECDFVLPTISALQAHIKEHRDANPKSLSKPKSAVRKRRKTNIEDGPYKCNICKNLFKLRKQLSAHKKVHMEKKMTPDKTPVKRRKWKKTQKVRKRKTLMCTECVRVFKDNILLDKHMITKHPVAFQAQFEMQHPIDFMSTSTGTEQVSTPTSLAKSTAQYEQANLMEFATGDMLSANDELLRRTEEGDSKITMDDVMMDTKGDGMKSAKDDVMVEVVMESPNDVPNGTNLDVVNGGNSVKNSDHSVTTNIGLNNINLIALTILDGLIGGYGDVTTVDEGDASSSYNEDTCVEDVEGATLSDVINGVQNDCEDVRMDPTLISDNGVESAVGKSQNDGALFSNINEGKDQKGMMKKQKRNATTFIRKNAQQSLTRKYTSTDIPRTEKEVPDMQTNNENEASKSNTGTQNSNKRAMSRSEMRDDTPGCNEKEDSEVNDKTKQTDINASRRKQKLVTVKRSEKVDTNASVKKKSYSMSEKITAKCSKKRKRSVPWAPTDKEDENKKARPGNTNTPWVPQSKVEPKNNRRKCAKAAETVQPISNDSPCVSVAEEGLQTNSATVSKCISMCTLFTCALCGQTFNDPGKLLKHSHNHSLRNRSNGSSMACLSPSPPQLARECSCSPDTDDLGDEDEDAVDAYFDLPSADEAASCMSSEGQSNGGDGDIAKAVLNFDAGAPPTLTPEHCQLATPTAIRQDNDFTYNCVRCNVIVTGSWHLFLHIKSHLAGKQ